jgi:ribosomal protein L29
MKASELREKTIKELKETLLSLKEEQFNLKIQKSLGI